MSNWRGGDSPNPGQPDRSEEGPVGPRKQSWKKDKSASTTTSGKYWATTSNQRPLLSSKAARLFLSLTILVTAVGSFLFYMLRQDIPTPLVSIAAIDYAHPWAPNGWVSEDQLGFQQLSENANFTVATKREKTEGTWQELVNLELEQARPGGPGGSILPRLFGYRSLVVHLSAHGVLNRAGTPCLLFSDADPVDDTTWVELSKVLLAVGEHPTVQDSNSRVLVVLDTGKQPPELRCGLLSTDFVQAARSQIEVLPLDNFAVLLACDDGQLAWTAPELGGSVFGFMLTLGLQGAADELSAKHNSRVTVEELHEFVSAATNRYVRETRGRVQTTCLVWSGGEEQARDFELCYASEQAGRSPTTYQGNARLKRMADAWSMLSEWSATSPAHTSWPRAMALARVARAEQLLWAGSAYDDQFDAELSRAERTLQSVAPAAFPDSVCGASLDFLRQFNDLASAAVGEPPNTSAAEPVRPADAASDKAAGDKAAPSTGAATNALGGGAADVAKDQPEPSVANNPLVNDITGQLTAWLTFNGQPAEGAESPKRPETPSRLDAVDLLYQWFTTNPQFLNGRILGRGLEWLGPMGNVHLVTREEALLRTIAEQLRYAESRSVSAEGLLGGLWGMFLKTAISCEQSIATQEFRASETLEGLSAGLLENLQAVRDQIHGCETDRDASDCTTAVRALAESAERLTDQRQRLETAWRLRDELAFDLPAIAQWLSSPFSRLSSSEISKAWETAQQLCQRLSALQQQLSAGDVPLGSELQVLEQQYEELAAVYSQALYRLVDASAASQRQPLGELVLSLGLRPTIFRGIPLPARGRLHRDLDGRYLDLSSTFAVERLVANYGNVLPDVADSQPLWSVKNLPLDMRLAFIPLVYATRELGLVSAADDGNSVATPSRAAAVGSDLREFLRTVPTRLVAESSASVDAMSGQDMTELRAAEERVLRSDFHAQLVSQLVPADLLMASVTPPAFAQAVSLQRFELWQARRALKDFWKVPLLPQSSNREFMFGSAADWQALARRVPYAPAGPVLIEETRQAAFAELARSWEQTLTGLQVKGGSNPEFSGQLAPAEFPTGDAWLGLAINGNRDRIAELSALGRKRLQLEIGTGVRARKGVEFKATATELPEGNHELLAWFRGHESILPLPIYRREPPLTLAWNIEPPGDTTVRVNADPTPARIVFILDCSASMKPDDLKVAKLRLMEAIEELPAQRTEVAVFVFGHSRDYGFSKQPDKINEAWNKDRPNAKRRPYNDVELILPLTSMASADGLINPEVVTRLRDDLEKLIPFGRTPLYEAILQADKLLQRQDGFDGLRKIVVVTDGKDDIYAKRDGVTGQPIMQGNWSVPAEYQHTAEDVKAKLTRGVLIDIVPFNFRSDSESQSELGGLAEHTGGNILFADSDSLAVKLNSSLSPDRFETYGIGSDTRRLGPPLPLAEKQDIAAERIPGNFEVRVNTSYRQQLAIFGGEAIELQFRRNSGLTFLPYAEGDAQATSDKFTMAGKAYQLLMLSGRPQSQPQVRMCLQALEDAVQSQRPDRWLMEVREVKPGLPDGRRLAWTSDAPWEGRHRSPVMRVPLINPPALVGSWLEIRIWYATQPSDNVLEFLPLSRFREQPVSIASDVQASAEVNTESSTLRVTLTESRQAESPMLHWTIDPQPDKRVEHQFYTDKVVHELFYKDATVESRIRLGAAPIPSQPQDNWQATEWIRVPRW